MKNIYHHELMVMLMRNGNEGMNVRQMARNLYNSHAGLFDNDIVFENIYSQVRSYMWRQSTIRQSPITWLRRGQYAMRPESAVQLDLFIDATYDTVLSPIMEQPQEEKQTAVQLELDF